MNELTQYSELIKPIWAPPSWIFGPVWTVLYLIIAVSFGVVFYKVWTKQIRIPTSTNQGRPWMVALPFALNLLFNFAFTPIQFGLKNNLLASIDILLVIATLVWALYTVWHTSPKLRWVVYVNIPYLLWGTFATYLQLTITYLNR
jgi:tryptophan-rich sensory protein